MEDMTAFENDCFDYVLTSHVLCSVKDVNKSLHEVYRVLKKVILFVMLLMIWPKTKNFISLTQFKYESSRKNVNYLNPQLLIQVFIFF